MANTSAIRQQAVHTTHYHHLAAQQEPYEKIENFLEKGPNTGP